MNETASLFRTRVHLQYRSSIHAAKVMLFSKPCKSFCRKMQKIIKIICIYAKLLLILRIES